MKIKVCTICNIKKKLSEFRINLEQTDKHRNECIDCTNEYNRKRYWKNHKTILEKNRKYRQDNKEKLQKSRIKWLNKNYNKYIKTQRKQRLKRLYNLTVFDYNKMLEAQNGVCAICLQKEKRINPKTNKVQRLSVDHNHKTGKIRNLLCYKCNKDVDRVEIDYNRFINIFKYLDKHN
jgi:hypothetical protein